MVRFDCDYLEGAHPRIIDALTRTNYEQTLGYGEDAYCEEASRLIKKVCNAENADVHFLIGGTGTNTAVISSALRPFQGVVCADSGHINVHESGAVEATGHKVIGLSSHQGKIDINVLENFLETDSLDPVREHTVQPGMLYISQPTECGTLYTADEMRRLRDICDRYSLYFYVDGARLGYGLAAKGNDVSLELLSELCDAFYIGGTKVGALFGEALVILNDSLKKDFRYMQKRQCGMLAKGRLLGIQFREMFCDGLYMQLGETGIRAAYRIRDAFSNAGFSFLFDSVTNQQFPIIPDKIYERLSEKVRGEFWCRVDEESCCIRFCSSWATTEENLLTLEKALSEL